MSEENSMAITNDCENIFNYKDDRPLTSCQKAGHIYWITQISSFQNLSPVPKAILRGEKKKTCVWIDGVEQRAQK